MATKTEKSLKERSSEIEAKLRDLSFSQQDIAMRHLWGQMACRASNGMNTSTNEAFDVLANSLAYAATRNRG